jgi:hypothetical protein
MFRFTMSSIRMDPVVMSELSLTKKRLPWLVLALVLTTGLYGLSFGPACWMAANNPRRQATVHAVYSPVLWLGSYGPQTVRNYIVRYANLRSHPYAVQIHKSQLYYRFWLLCPSHLD